MKRYAILSAVQHVAMILVMLAAVAPARAAELVMFESDICHYCERWHDEVGEAYKNSPEGKCAPLRRVDIYEDMPKDLQSLGYIHFTPTFVVMDEGKEVARLIGYAGDQLFWPLINERLAMLDKKCPN